MTEQDQAAWFTVQEVAELLKVNEETVRRWVRRGELPVLQLGRGRAGYRIRRADVDAFTEQRYGLMGKAAA